MTDLNKKIDVYLENLFGYKEEDIEKYVDVSGGVIIKLIDNIPHVLLIQRASDDHFPLYWEIPRGRCDKGKNGKPEKPKPCLRREVKEEVGLDVRPVYLIDKFSYYVKDEKRKSTQSNFLCIMKNKNQEVRLSKEHQDYKWVKSMGEVELLVLPEIRNTISKVLNVNKSLINYSLKSDGEQIIEET